MNEEKPKTILWVDDDATLLNHAAMRLREAGYIVLVAESVDWAIDVLRERHSEIRGVILDLMMDPGKALQDSDHDGGFETGFRLIDFLYSEGILPKISLFVLTNKHPIDSFYQVPGSDIRISCERKSRYKAVKFVKLVERKFN